jgi:hypothetical protein
VFLRPPLQPRHATRAFFQCSFGETKLLEEKYNNSLAKITSAEFWKIANF